MVHALPSCASAQRLADLEQHTLASLANLIATVQSSHSCADQPPPEDFGYDCNYESSAGQYHCDKHTKETSVWPYIYGMYPDKAACQGSGAPHTCAVQPRPRPPVVKYSGWDCVQPRGAAYYHCEKHTGPTTQNPYQKGQYDTEAACKTACTPSRAVASPPAPHCGA